MDPDVRAYVDAIPSYRRALFDRLHGLILEVFPDVEVVLSYRIPTYVLGGRRLHVGAWKHGLSAYGWQDGADGGLTRRHPELVSGRGTIRLTPAAAAGITDDELRAFVRAALASDAGA